VQFSGTPCLLLLIFACLLPDSSGGHLRARVHGDVTFILLLLDHTVVLVFQYSSVRHDRSSLSARLISSFLFAGRGTCLSDCGLETASKHILFIAVFPRVVSWNICTCVYIYVREVSSWRWVALHVVFRNFLLINSRSLFDS
jgi:hypothetical protein